jgi:hypothetical protein
MFVPRVVEFLHSQDPKATWFGFAQRKTGMSAPLFDFPLRLFLPGYEGNANVKWLRRLKLGDQPFQTREETSKYTDLMPDGTARLAIRLRLF